MTAPRDGRLLAAAVAGLLAGCSQAASPPSATSPSAAHPAPSPADPSTAPAGRPAPLLGRLGRAEPGALAVAVDGVQPGERVVVFVRAKGAREWILVGNG